MSYAPNWAGSRAARRVGTLGIGLALALAALAVPRAAAALDHCGDITRNETWSPFDNPHIITCDVTVRNSTLTLQPGTFVQIAEGADLILATGAKLDARGTADTPINIVGATRNQTPGFWGQIRLEPGSLLSALNYAIVTGGGHDGVPMVDVRGEGLEMAFVNSRLSGDVPLAFAAATLGPSLAAAGGVSVGRCEVIAFSSVGTEFIHVYADAEVDITQDADWSEFCMPYRVDGPLVIGSEESPTLTLNPGVELKFVEDGEIVAGIDADRPGQLNLNGSVDQRVVLAGLEEGPGSWGGVTLSEHGFGSFLIHAMLRDGGRGGRAMLRVKDPGASSIEVFARGAEAYPIAIDAKAVGSFFGEVVAPPEPLIAENGIDRVLVIADEEEPDVPSSATWGDIGVPYEVRGDLLVAGLERTATLSLQAGAELWFDGEETLTIGDPELGAGGFVVRASTARPAILRGAEEVPGSWGGLRLVEAPEAVVVEGLAVRHGGAGGDTEAAMVEWGDVRGTVIHSTFEGAAGYPLRILLTRVSAVMGEEQVEESQRNTFRDNGLDRILVEVDSRLTERSSKWPDPGAPVEFDDDVLVAATGVPLIEAYAGLRLLMRPGKTFGLGVDRDSRAVIRLLDSRVGDRVVFGAADEDGAGWDGLRVNESSILETRGDDVLLEIGGLAADGEGLRVADGRVVLDGLSIEGDGGEATGIHVTQGGEVEVTAPRLTGLAVGALASEGGRLVLQSGWIEGNAEYGVKNEDAALCQTANLIWWGSPDGPNDPSAAEDGCMDSANESDGDLVSDDIDWAGYAIDEDLTPVGGIVGRKKVVFLPVGWR